MPMRACLFAALFGALAAAAWSVDVRLGVAASVHLARHPSYEEPLAGAPVAFATVGAEITEDSSGIGADFAAARAGGWLDWEAVFRFRHTLLEGRGILMPFLQVGAGWTARSSLDTGEINLAALFPEAGAGVEAQWGSLAAQVAVSYRPAPLPVPLLEADAYPLRRIAFVVRVSWIVRPGDAGPPGPGPRP